MKIFHYTQTAHDAGMKSLPALIICSLIIAWFLYKKLAGNADTMSNLHYLLIAGGIALIAAFANNVYKRINSDGTWDISIDDKTIQWNAPNELEESFILNLNQIAEVKQTIGNHHTSYELNTTDDQNIQLNEDSGIDLEEFTKALVSQGVHLNKIDETHDSD